MKTLTLKLIYFLGAAFLLFGCSSSRYDISDGFNKDITLFSDEISVPVGSIGPVSVLSLLMNSSVGAMLSDFVKEGADGTLLVESEQPLYAVNVFRIQEQAADPSQPFTFASGDHEDGVGGIVSLLGYLGISCLDQRVTLSATNPLMDAVPVRAVWSVSGSECSLEEPVDLSLPRNAFSPYVIKEVSLPAVERSVPSSVVLGGLEMDLPAYPVNRIYDDTRQDVFRFICTHSCKLGTTESLSLSQTIDVEDAALQIGKFRLKRCEVCVEVSSTLPIALKLKGLRLMKEDESGNLVPDENITVSSDVTIAGGTLEKPGVTAVNLFIEAVEGSIPDIHAMEIDIEINGQAGCEDEPLSSRQALSITSSTAKIVGGITIPLN